MLTFVIRELIYESVQQPRLGRQSIAMRVPLGLVIARRADIQVHINGSHHGLRREQRDEQTGCKSGNHVAIVTDWGYIEPAACGNPLKSSKHAGDAPGGAQILVSATSVCNEHD